ncbi:transmembrane anchor protein [Aeromonas caviae]|uniref:transmembrane anchor protein n=1 Tax=Aeromonas caviae TaxID=648 RepID=UPI0009BA25BB|nr:transmembrane anchor protein [Aeromonas caviae]
MFNAQKPHADDLPTTTQLIKSTISAFIVAVLLLVTVVMPSEYAIDPTGVGRILGLTQMGEVKQVLAAEEGQESTTVASPPLAYVSTPNEKPFSEVGGSKDDAQPQEAPSEKKPNEQTHEMSITLAPNQGAEIKLEMTKGAMVDFHWTANGGKVNFDTHGDPYDAPKDFYHGYGKGRSIPEDKGVLVAAFDGKHGWFWRNRTDKQVTITLLTKGEYLKINRVI